MTRLAVFDLDGTLVDSVDDLAASVNHALAAVGLPAAQRATRSAGSSARARAGSSSARSRRAPSSLEPALAALARALRRALPRPDAALPRRGRGARAAPAARSPCTRTSPAPLARKILAGLGVAARFAEVVGGDEAPRKPDPAGTLGIMARVGAAPADAVFVGDSRVDVATARAAGVALVAVDLGARAAARRTLAARGRDRVRRATPRELAPTSAWRP